MLNSEIISRGDKFFFRYIVILLFVQLGIVIPARRPSESFLALEGAQEINRQQERLLKLRLNTLQAEEDPKMTFHHLEQQQESLLGLRLKTLQAEEGPQMAFRHRLTNFYTEPRGSAKLLEDLSAKKILKEMEEIQSKLIKLSIEYADLEKKKSAKQFSLPLIDVGIEEEAVFLLYPGFVFAGLLGIFWHRYALLKNIDKPEGTFPLWAFPLPFRLVKTNFRSWVFLNTLSISIISLIIFLVVDFLQWTRLKPFYNKESATINWSLAIVTMIFSAYSLLKAFIQDFKDNGQSSKED